LYEKNGRIYWIAASREKLGDIIQNRPDQILWSFADADELDNDLTSWRNWQPLCQGDRFNRGYFQFFEYNDETLMTWMTSELGSMSQNRVAVTAGPSLASTEPSRVHRAKSYQSTTTTIGSTFGTISMDSKYKEDPQNIASLTDNSITIDVSGHYEIRYGVDIVPDGNNNQTFPYTCEVRVLNNNISDPLVSDNIPVGHDYASSVGCKGSKDLYIPSGQEILIEAKQNSGGTVESGSSINSTFLSIRKLSE